MQFRGVGTRQQRRLSCTALRDTIDTHHRIHTEDTGPRGGARNAIHRQPSGVGERVNRRKPRVDEGVYHGVIDSDSDAVDKQEQHPGQAYPPVRRNARGNVTRAARTNDSSIEKRSTNRMDINALDLDNFRSTGLPAHDTDA